MRVFLEWLHGLVGIALRYIREELTGDANAYFNRKIPPDVLGVLDAAAELDTTEFGVFRVAYHDWFGNEPDDKELERHFARYMFCQVAPPWVRDYTRRVRRSAASGPVDRRRFGIAPEPEATRESIRRGRLAIVSIIFVCLLLYFLAETSADRIFESIGHHCLLPPCY